MGYFAGLTVAVMCHTRPLYALIRDALTIRTLHSARIHGCSPIALTLFNPEFPGTFSLANTLPQLLYNTTSTGINCLHLMAND